MKKYLLAYILILFTLLSFLLVVNKVYAYSETGHEDFKKITFVKDGKLLKDYSWKEIDKAYDEMGKKIFGWKTEYFNYQKEANYEGIVIFSRSNQSSKSIDFEYVLKETEVTKTSVTVSGSVSTKITGSIKKINTNITVDGEVKKTKQDENSYSSDTKTTLSFSIMPKRKLTLLVIGKCYITNGVSRYKFLGITFKKGSWETIDVETIIYELREEKV